MTILPACETMPPARRAMARVLAWAVTVAAATVAALPARAADWPQWRGPTHNGISADASGYPKGWPPKRLWAKDVGVGCTSPILADGCLYVMGWQGPGNTRSNPMGQDVVRCLDARSGKELWRRTYPCRYHCRQRAGDLGQYGGPSSTPTIDPETGHLYTLSTDGHLACWNARAGGRPVWDLNLYETFPVPQKPDVGKGRREYGYPQSPLVLGKLLIVEVGSSEGTVIAFDKRTGAPAWRSEATALAGHTGGPAPMTVEGAACLATLALRNVIVMRTDAGHEGRTVGEVAWTTDFANNIPTPATWRQFLVVTSNYNVSRTACFEVSLRGLTEKWRVRDHAKVCSPVIYKGRVFLVDGTAKCLDLATGRRLWQGGNFYHGSCIVTAGDDRLVVFGQGRLVLLEAMADAYRELGKVGGLFKATCYPHVALANGLIAVKDMKGNLVVLDAGG